MNDVSTAAKGRIAGQEHWTSKGDAKLFLWEKRAPGGPKNGTVLFVHGSSMASQPVFDLHVPGRPNSSAMEYFAERGFDAWCIDHEGYGRSTKDRGTGLGLAIASRIVSEHHGLLRVEDNSPVGTRLVIELPAAETAAALAQEA